MIPLPKLTVRREDWCLSCWRLVRGAGSWGISAGFVCCLSIGDKQERETPFSAVAQIDECEADMVWGSGRMGKRNSAYPIEVCPGDAEWTFATFRVGSSTTGFSAADGRLRRVAGRLSWSHRRRCSIRCRAQGDRCKKLGDVLVRHAPRPFCIMGAGQLADHSDGIV